MGCDYTTTITTLSGGLFAPNTILTPVLQATGNSSIKHTGVHLGNGTYKFINIDDGKYKLYESDGGAEITKWGGTQGRWIGDDNMEAYELSGTCVKLAGGNTISGGNAFVSAAPVSYVPPTLTDHLTRKDYVDTLATGLQNGIDSLESATASLNSNKAGLGADQTFTGHNIFNGVSNGKRVKIYGGNSSGTKTELYGWTYFMDTCPSLIGGLLPTSGQHLVNKYYVDTSLSAITNGLSATYQQSQNIIRLVPDGIGETNRLYTSWGQAVYNATTRTPSATKQFTIEIEGNGVSSDSVIMQAHDPINSFPAYADNIHFKGYGSNVLVTSDIGFMGQSLSASAIGKIVVENLIIQDPLGDTYTADWYNIIFKNCKFISRYDTYYSTWAINNYYNCKFEGGNEFIGGDSSSWTYTDCLGERIFTEQTPTIAGTNKIQYYTPSKIAIGVNTLSDNAGILDVSSGVNIAGGFTTNSLLVMNNVGNRQPSNPTSGAPSDYWGNPTYGLGNPDRWMTITIDGTAYSIPCFQQ